MFQIMCISGKRGSGKSMLAKYLRNYGFEIKSLAGNLKERCKNDFGLTDEQLYGMEKEAPTQYKRTDGHCLSARDIMIRMGVFYRSVDPLFWCRQIELSPKIVIDDLRFMNEVNYFKRLGAKFIRIERDIELNIYKAAMDDTSETELDSFKEWDHYLSTELNKTPDDLHKFAEKIVDSLL